MLPVLNGLRSISMESIAVRMFLAVICGGLIGLEREYKRRPAGFRTHILICLGAAMTTLTSQYLLLYMHYYTDMARLGAQVVAGIGFIGAGTIIVTGHQRVKGLTTAAGLWTSAIVGLCLGCGFLEGAFITTILILTAELLFSKMEYYFQRITPEINLYLEYAEQLCIDEIIKVLHKRSVKILNMEISHFTRDNSTNTMAYFTLRLNKKSEISRLLEDISCLQSVMLVEQI